MLPCYCLSLPTRLYSKGTSYSPPIRNSYQQLRNAYSAGDSLRPRTLLYAPEHVFSGNGSQLSTLKKRLATARGRLHGDSFVLLALITKAAAPADGASTRVPTPAAPSIAVVRGSAASLVAVPELARVA